MQADAVVAVARGCGRRFPASRRLRRPADFAAVLASDRGQSIRAAGRWLAVQAAWASAETATARLGITVSKRMARRALDRALVKRTVREAFRAAAADMERGAALRGLRIDVSVRMKRPLALPTDPHRPTLPVWRRELRADADHLLSAVVAGLESIDRHA